jgi:hypothetical protein
VGGEWIGADGQATRAGKDESTGCTCAARTEHERTVIQWGDVRVVSNSVVVRRVRSVDVKSDTVLRGSMSGTILARRGEARRDTWFVTEMDGPR